MRYRWAAVIAAIGIVLAALYVLLMYQRVMTGPMPSFAEGEAPPDLSTPREARRRADHRLVPRCSGSSRSPCSTSSTRPWTRTLQIVGVTDPPRPTPPGVPQ